MDVHKTSKKMAQANAGLAFGGDFYEKVRRSQTRMEIDHFGRNLNGACVQLVHYYYYYYYTYTYSILII